MTAVSAQRFSTQAFAPRERVPVWRDLFGHTIAKLDFEPLSDGELKAEADLHKLPDLGLVTMASEKLRFHKLRSLIDNDDLVLAIVDSGGWAGSQLGREAELAPGDAVLCTNSEIAVGISFGRRTMLRVPRKVLAPMVRDIDAVVLRRISAETPTLRLLKGYIDVVQSAAALATPELRRLTVTHVHDLMAATLGATRDAQEGAGARGLGAARLKAIKEDVTQSLGTRDVSVGAIALRHQVTPRYIQMLFESDGTTFTDYVLGQRLARAHRMLTGQAGEKIIAIAYDAGFANLSYFNRAFRRRYGASPSDVRAQARAH